MSTRSRIPISRTKPSNQGVAANQEPFLDSSLHTSEPIKTTKAISNRRKNRTFIQSCRSYWFVLLPALICNGVLTIDHVLAKNNERIFRVNVGATELSALGSEAQDDQAMLGESLQSHWIIANQEGNIEGRISTIDPDRSLAIPIEELDITLLKKGEKIRTSVTGDNGSFLLEDVDPGVYTLVASGQNGFLAYGVHVLPRPEMIEDLDGDTQFDSSPRNSMEAHRAYYVSHFGVPANALLSEELQIDAAAVPPEFTTLEAIIQNYVPTALGMGGAEDQDDLKAIAKATMIRGGFQFPLDDDGNFNGRVQPIATEAGELTELSEMNLFLIQDDVQTNQVAIDANGKFVVEDVIPGVYSMIAAGRDGFAALSIELVGSDNARPGAEPGGLDASGADISKSGHYVSIVNRSKKAAPSLGIAIVTDVGDLKFIRQEVQRISELRRQPVAQQRFANQPFNGQQGVFQGGAAPGGGFAPGAFAPPAPGFAPPSFAGAPGFSGPPPFSGLGSGGNLLPIAAIAAAIAIPVAISNASDPPVESPSTTVSLSPNTSSN